MEERNNPIPFIVLAAFAGWLFGSLPIGLVVGVAMTIIPGVALIALIVNNLVIRVIVGLFMVLGFPFFLIFTGIRRLFGGGHSAVDDES